MHQYNDHIPHGYGVCIYSNRDKYEGLWDNGSRSGIGKLFEASGDCYEGEWVDNKK